MPTLKTYKPVTPTLRFTVLVNKKDLWQGGPEKSLVEKIDRSYGRNHHGHITSRGRERGNKKLYRIIDFKRDKLDIPAKVVRIEYDPNRTAFIALVVYADGEKRYIIAPENIKVGDTIISSDNPVEIKTGNATLLNNIPVGTFVHNIELYPGKGGQIARAAGTYAQIMGKEGEYVILKLPSGEYRKIFYKCRATIGIVSNVQHINESWGKAGRSRWLGWRPITRGEARNPVDHPLGGRTRGGRIPVSPWGWPTKGKKTRKNKVTDKFIIRRRKG